METIIFCGIQGSGKSTFYKERFFRTHVRISLDLLNTRNKERQFLKLCGQLHQAIVIDNTNVTIADRQRYIAHAQNYRNRRIICYYFDESLADCLTRNAQRTGKARMPEVGVRSTFRKKEPPTYAEGFDELYHVSLSPQGEFLISHIPKKEDEIKRTRQKNADLRDRC